MFALRPRTFKSVPGSYYGTPKEIWGFLADRQPGSPAAIARSFLKTNAALLGLHPNLEGISRRKVIESLGAHHVIFQQFHLDRRIHRAYVTVHLDRKGRVYMAKNRAVPGRLLPDAHVAKLSLRDAIAKARRALPSPGRSATVLRHEKLWFPKGKSLVPAWQVRIKRLSPPEEWIVYVNARTGAILHKYDNLAYASGRALVFDPSPVTALGTHVDLITKQKREKRPPKNAYVNVRLSGLAASGYLDGKRVSTEGTRNRVRSRTHSFCFASHERGFEEAMVYYHVDRAIRYVEELGYRGRRTIFRDAIRADVRGTRDDNSWYSPETRSLTFGTGQIDDAEDAETILHELGHAIQDAIVPDFGQSVEAAAMGEGFGDYFAGSFFAEKKPAKYRNVVMTWDGLLIGLEEGTVPPALRTLNSGFTYRDFSSRGDEHDNGMIWSATLWDIRRALGRRIADTIILESHFELDGFTTFARGARAIMNADEHLYRGRHLRKLRAIFTRRHIGPL